MDYTLKEAVFETIARMPRQETYEVISALLPFEQELGFTVSNYFLIPNEDLPLFGPIPLDNIRAVMTTDRYVVLLCRNDVIHCFDRQTVGHEVILPDSDVPAFWEMFLLMCKSYLERLKMNG